MTLGLIGTTEWIIILFIIGLLLLYLNNRNRPRPS